MRNSIRGKKVVKQFHLTCDKYSSLGLDCEVHSLAMR